MWFTSSSGRIELKMTMEQARSASHQGQCDADVLALSKVPAIARQLVKIDPALLSAELKEYGAWDEAELLDHHQNIQRLLWIAASDIVEEFYTRQRGSASTIAAAFVVALFLVFAVAVMPLINSLGN